MALGAWVLLFHRGGSSHRLAELEKESTLTANGQIVKSGSASLSSTSQLIANGSLVIQQIIPNTDLFGVFAVYGADCKVIKVGMLWGRVVCEMYKQARKMSIQLNEVKTRGQVKSIYVEMDKINANLKKAKKIKVQLNEIEAKEEVKNIVAELEKIEAKEEIKNIMAELEEIDITEGMKGIDAKINNIEGMETSVSAKINELKAKEGKNVQIKINKLNRKEPRALLQLLEGSINGKIYDS